MEEILNDRQKVLAWLDHIGEKDQSCIADIIKSCIDDKEARAYYVSRFETRGEHDYMQILREELSSANG